MWVFSGKVGCGLFSALVGMWVFSGNVGLGVFLGKVGCGYSPARWGSRHFLVILIDLRVFISSCYDSSNINKNFPIS